MDPLRRGGASYACSLAEVRLGEWWNSGAAASGGRVALQCSLAVRGVAGVPANTQSDEWGPTTTSWLAAVERVAEHAGVGDVGEHLSNSPPGPP